jgi:hypothetical protein
VRWPQPPLLYDSTAREHIKAVAAATALQTHNVTFRKLYVMSKRTLVVALPHRDINAIVFSPASPDVLYFGLKVSDMTN